MKSMNDDGIKRVPLGPSDSICSVNQRQMSTPHPFAAHHVWMWRPHQRLRGNWATALAGPQLAQQPGLHVPRHPGRGDGAPEGA